MASVIKKTAIFIKKNKRILFLLFPVLPIAITFFFIYKPPVDFVVSSLKKNGIAGFTVYDDRSDKGNSVSGKLSDSNTVGFTYTLQKGVEYPFAGIAFYPNKKEFFDLSAYDYIKINIRATKGRRLPVFLTTYIENYTRPEEFNTLKNNQFILNVNSDFQEIIVHLDDLKTPEWWYTVNHKLENQVAEADYTKVKGLNITHCIALGNGKSDKVEIQEISFHVNLIPFFIYALIASIIYYSAGYFLLRKGNRSKTEVSFVYEKTETVNQLDKEEEMVFQFLTSNYQKSDLSIVEVQLATGIYEQKISAIIRKKTDMNFKQFLNKLRVSEAKRLLRETDLQISEIAFKAGYGNVSHFNRVFKELENCSPNEYRKQGEAAIS